MRINADLVRRIAGRVDRVMKRSLNKFPGRVIKVIYCLRTSPGLWRRPIGWAYG